MGLRKRLRDLRNWCPEPPTPKKPNSYLSFPREKSIRHSLWFKILVVTGITVVLVAALFGYMFFQNAVSQQPAQNVYATNPINAIVINADGTVSPGASGTMPISSSGNVYYINGALEDELIVEKNNIVIDGSGLASTFNGNYPNQNIIQLQGVNNVTVENVEISPAFYLIYLDDASNCKVENSNCSQINLENSNHNVILDSEATYVCSLRTASNNTINNCGIGGFDIEMNSNYNVFLNNNCTLDNSNRITLYDASYNLFFGNTFGTCFRWVYMGTSDKGATTGNLFVANNVTTGKLIIPDILVGKNTFYHNNFIDFAWNGSATTDSANTWSSNGQGNYWSNYNGTGTNGVGTTPYIIDATNRDDYPLLEPVNISQENIPTGYLSELGE